MVDIDIIMRQYVKQLFKFAFESLICITKIVALSGSVSFNITE